MYMSESIERQTFNNSIRCIGLQRHRLRVSGPIAAANLPLHTAAEHRRQYTLRSDQSTYLIPDNLPTSNMR